jgi:hypothetical protein
MKQLDSPTRRNGTEIMRKSMISMKKRVQIEIGKKEQAKNKEKKMTETSLKMGT